MPRKADMPLERRGREIIFYMGDFEALKDICAPTGIPPSVLIRKLVHKFIRKTQAKASLQQKNLPHDLDLDALDASGTDESGEAV